MTKNPWMKFYPTDWLAEPKLKTISRAARSLWFDMLCLMHQAGNGRLEIDGRPTTEKELAQILGDNPRTIRMLLAEIEGAGVSSRIEGDFIISRRLIQDNLKAEKDKLNGSKGGNPLLKINDLAENWVNPEVKAQNPEARSHRPEDEKEEREGPKTRGVRIPEDFEPDGSSTALADDLGMSNPDRKMQLESFRDYWKSLPGTKGVKLDWQATFRNWLRNYHDRNPQGRLRATGTRTPRGGGHAVPSKPNRQDDIRAAVDSVREQLRATGHFEDDPA